MCEAGSALPTREPTNRRRQPKVRTSAALSIAAAAHSALQPAFESIGGRPAGSVPLLCGASAGDAHTDAPAPADRPVDAANGLPTCPAWSAELCEGLSSRTAV